MITRPLEMEEYRDMIELITNGFSYTDKEGKERKFRRNDKLALALILQANLGLRIGDVLALTLNNFQNNKLVIAEDKTEKLQNREVNQKIIQLIYDYAIENKLDKKDKLFNRLSVRAVQKQLKIVTEHLNLINISTHSFRKMYAVIQYENNNNNIELVKELLNHSSIATTQRYIRVSQNAINEASKNICLL